MTDRIQLKTECYMQVDGQWQIALPGSVFDVPDARSFSAATASILSPSETAGTLALHGKPTSVRGLRTR